MNNTSSLETEEILTASLILQPDSLLEILDIIKPEMMEDFRCRIIFDHVLKLYDEGKRSDMIILCDRLSQSKQLEKIGGYMYVALLTSKVASASNIVFHAQIIYQYYFKRKLATIFSSNLAMIANGQMVDVLDVYSSAMAQLEQMSTQIISNGMKHISEVMPGAIKKIYERKEKYEKGVLSGITTGLDRLDALTCGWEGNKLVVLAARPAMGKTALLLHFALSAALGTDKNICVYSLEMSRESLLGRMIHRNTNIDPSDYKKGNLNASQLQEIESSVHILNNLSISFDDKSGCDLRYIVSNSRLLHSKGLCDMIIIDYLQIMDMDYPNMNREQSVAKTTKDLKGLAKELDITIIILAQLSRQVESRPDKKPMLSDLRESGAIEQDADMVMFIWRPAYYDFETIEVNGMQINTEGYGELIMAKHRDGDCGTVQFKHNQSLTRIEDWNKPNVNGFMGIDNIPTF